MTNVLRTQKMEDRYEKHLKSIGNKCPLCKKSALKSFKYWKIVKNDFPYDKIAQKHNLIIPYRHVVENKLNQKELTEFKRIKNSFINKAGYDYIMEAIDKSLSNHFHLHLIVFK